MAGKNNFSLSLPMMIVCLAGLVTLTGSRAFSGIIITFDRANPPFMYEHEGNATGLYPAIIAKAFWRMNEPVTLIPLPWKRAQAGADEGKWGIGGLYLNQQRLWKYDYSTPIYEERLMVYMMKTKRFPFREMKDLRGKRIGVMRGWTYGDGFDEAVAAGWFETVQLSDDRSNFHRLLLGRVDAALAAPETWDLIRADVDPDGQIMELGTPLTVNRTYLSFPKSQNMTDVLQRFNTEIRRMREDGAMDQLVQTYLR
ncbi:polar amino acid transport system substrate-binding protein [Desulfomicrobium macestii]|uniref:Polar amino acid transport system substrate-binding protein n=1 Tax=Desulfomicrobium macestii TaxID=90731 RepID=A0ABR9H6C9_9BACT|nr:transporter substrate-binding domain-containing protein [Desulfomicrobium macestii]MBE1426261.1 polar amino acid transport system substrate-binding protein [Desulfomicrobium macestii]